MKLARKLTLGLVLGILVVMVVYAYVQIRREVVLSDADLLRAKRIGLAWMGTAEAVWQHEGQARLAEIIAQANRRTSGITLRLLTFDQRKDDPALATLPESEWEALQRGNIARVVRPDADGTDWRYVYAPLTVGGEHPAIVEVVESLEPEQTFVRMNHAGILAATLAIVLVCAAVAIGLQYRLVGRPLQLLRDKARRAGGGDFSGPVTLPQRDEMGELAEELNAMCARIEDGNRQLAAATEARIGAIEQLRHSDRLATIGQLAAGVAHELGTPLSVISARAEILAGSAAGADVEKSGRIIVEQADRMAAIIQQLLDYSRRRGGTPAMASLQHLVTRTVDLLSAAAQRGRVDVRCNAVGDATLAAVDQNQIQQALTNIVLNGIQAMPQGGELHIDVGVRRVRPPAGRGRGEGEYAYVHVADSGMGIPPEQLPHIFEPFFTTKRAGEGTGLGLAVADGILAEHGGWIAAESTPGEGSSFYLFLPRAAAGAAAA